MGLISKRTSSLISVDIGCTAVKLLQLTRVGCQLRVDYYASEPLPPHAVVEKNILQVETVGQTIHRALARSGAKSRAAVAAVAGSAVITKTVPMPAELDEDELEALVELEAANYIPYPVDEVNLDFEVLGPLPGDTSMVQTLLVASRSENIEQRRLALELGGLAVKVIDVEIFAVEKALALMAADLPVRADALIALVDIGAMMITLNVMRAGRSIYHREQVFAGTHLNDLTHREHLINDETVTTLRAGNLAGGGRAQALEPFEALAVLQINRLLQLFYAGNEFSQVDQVVLAGDAALLRGLPAMVEDQLGIPTAIANPLSGASSGPAVSAQALADDAPALMIATGLALRSWD